MSSERESRTVRRVLVTDAEDFLGPAVVERFRRCGDHVTAHTHTLATDDHVAAVVGDAGPFDVVVANLEVPITVAAVTAHDDTTTREVFDRLVHPLFRLLAGCLPAMVAAGRGAVVVPTSATAIRSSSHPIAAYEAGRAAQLALVRSAGAEMATHGVRINGVAPNFIENPSYFPPETVTDPAFRAEMQRTVPAGRLGSADEAAAVVEWLASDDASYVFGAIIPVDGGWTLGG